MSLRGVLRGFGLKVGRDDAAGHSTAGSANSCRVIRRCWRLRKRLLAARATLGEQLQKLEKRVRSVARDDMRTRLLMSAPGVGAIVALTYVAAIDDPARFRSSKAAGAHFGLTPKKYQSGRDRRHRADLEDRRRGRAHRALRGGQRHPDPAGEGLIAEELGDARGQARRHAQGEGGAGAQARRRPAPDAGRRDPVHGRQGGCAPHRKERSPVRAATDTSRPEQVPSPGRWIRSGR